MTWQAFHWWLIVEAIGLIALPIALMAFRRLPGAGYAFAKPLGILLGAYLFWLALSLHILPNRPGSIVWVFLLLVAVDALLVRGRWPQLVQALRERLGLIIAVEVLFALSFAVAVYLRSYVPEIGGTEKPMDFMLLNAASRSRFYPPDDAWLSGFGVSYYYLGFVIQAMLAKLAVVPTSVAFNLGLAGTAALASTAAFGLGYELARIGAASQRAALLAGATGAVLVVLLGNLEGAVEFAIANGVAPSGFVRWLDIANLDQAQESTACLISGLGRCLEYPNEQSSFWWWWRATRISPEGNSITEFPFFSFLLGDLHPHVMAVPYVLTLVGLGLALWRSEARLDGGFWLSRPALLLLSAVLLGSLGFLNAWDLPAFAFVIALLVLARTAADADMPLSAWRGWLGPAARFLAPLLLLAVLLYLPFYISFSSQAGGIEAVTDGATRPVHSLLFWGPLITVCLPLPLLVLARARRRDTGLQGLAPALLLPASVVVFWALGVALKHGPGDLIDAVTARGLNWLTLLFFAGALAASLLALWQSIVARATGAVEAALTPVLVLMASAFLLVLGAELFYVSDVFRSRLNTVFKLYYQAWLLLAVGGSFGVYWLARELWSPASENLWPRRAWAAAVVAVLAAALLYPIGATLSRTNGLSAETRTLDGLAYARREVADDFAALRWLHDRASINETIMEAIGGQYSSFARVSAWTGIPTVIGWAGHELQWGRDGAELSRRQADIDRAYSSASFEEALSVLREYDVKYVFVGSLERMKYAPDGLLKFEMFMDAAFRSGNTAVYRVPVEIDAPGEAR